MARALNRRSFVCGLLASTALAPAAKFVSKPRSLGCSTVVAFESTHDAADWLKDFVFDAEGAEKGLQSLRAYGVMFYRTMADGPAEVLDPFDVYFPPFIEEPGAWWRYTTWAEKQEWDRINGRAV